MAVTLQEDQCSVFLEDMHKPYLTKSLQNSMVSEWNKQKDYPIIES